MQLQLLQEIIDELRKITLLLEANNNKWPSFQSSDPQCICDEQRHFSAKAPCPIHGQY